MDKILNGIPFCGGCMRKEKRSGLKRDEYYCALVVGQLRNGIVTSDTDASECIANGNYLPLT